MTSPIDSPKKKSIFYGWIVLAGTMIIVLMGVGTFGASFGVFLPEISADLGWSRGTISIAMTIGMAVFGLPSPLIAIFVNRFGPRKAMILGNMMAGLGLAAVGLVNSVWQFYLLFGFIGLGLGLGNYLPGATLAANWFVKKRPLALGLFTASGGIGGLIYPPFTTSLIESIGWRGTWAILGALIFVICGIICAVVLIRNRPEDKGQLPDGRSSRSSDSVITHPEPETIPHETSTSKYGTILKQPTIWFIGGFAAANGFTLGVINSHQAAYLQDIGLTPMSAATTLSVLFTLGFIGSLLLGSLALKFSIKILATSAFALQLVAMIIILSSHDIFWIYAYSVLVGLGNGAMITAMPTTVGFLYHGNRYSQVIGIILPFQLFFQSASGTVAGLIFDATLSYIPTFYIIIGLLVFGIIMVLSIRMPSHTSR